jgi:outer membrane murein-binding lipoprotein Lpp
MDDPTTTRRRLLEGASVGGGALLAGCTDQLDLGGGSGTDAAQTDAAGSTVDGVGAIATVDREALQQDRIEIRQELQNGNLTQEEARTQFAELQEEYISEAVAALAETATATDGVDVVAEYPSLGAVVLSGAAVPIIGLLDSADVNALVSQSDVEDRAGTATATESA